MGVFLNAMISSMKEAWRIELCVLDTFAYRFADSLVCCTESSSEHRHNETPGMFESTLSECM